MTKFDPHPPLFQPRVEKNFDPLTYSLDPPPTKNFDPPTSSLEPPPTKNFDPPTSSLDPPTYKKSRPPHLHFDNSNTAQLSKHSTSFNNTFHSIHSNLFVELLTHCMDNCLNKKI